MKEGILIAFLFIMSLLAVGNSIVNFERDKQYAKTIAENQELKNAFSKYTVANGKNIGRARALGGEYESVSDELGVPVALINAAQIHENMGAGFEFGVKKIYKGIENHEPKEWQARAAAHIFTYEIFDYVMNDPVLRAEYMQRLAKRYCYFDRKNWAKSVEEIFTSEAKQ